jgi:hypothetical protein
MNAKNYVQYVTKSGIVKVKDVERQVDGNLIIFNLDSIPEDFFLLGLYADNKKLTGLTFQNVANLDMLAFLNSDFQTVELLPEIAFFSAYQFIAIAYDLTNELQSTFQFQQKTNELVFLESYLKTEPLFFGIKYTIYPFIKNFQAGVGTISPDNVTLYYCRLSNSEGSDLSNGVTVDNFVFMNPNNEYHLFTDVFTFEYKTQLVGYKVVFETPVYYTGGGTL